MKKPTLEAAARQMIPVEGKLDQTYAFRISSNLYEGIKGLKFV